MEGSQHCFYISIAAPLLFLSHFLFSFLLLPPPFPLCISLPFPLSIALLHPQFAVSFFTRLERQRAIGMSIQSSNDLHDWSARVIERRTVLDFDLNCPPPDECIDPTGPRDEAGQYYNHYQGQATDAIDEDIAIISPRKFAEARKNFRRNHFESGCGAVIRRNGNTEVYGTLSDVTTWPPFTIWSPLTISNNVSIQEQQTIHNLDLRLSCESSSRATKAKTDTDIPSTLALSSSIPPTDRTLRCAICIEPLVEETTTKCGHVFCRNCIETAIATQHRCPICRRKLRKRDIIRIYLPFTS